MCCCLSFFTPLPRTASAGLPVTIRRSPAHSLMSASWRAAMMARRCVAFAVSAIHASVGVAQGGLALLILVGLVSAEGAAAGEEAASGAGAAATALGGGDGDGGGGDGVADAAGKGCAGGTEAGAGCVQLRIPTAPSTITTTSAPAPRASERTPVRRLSRLGPRDLLP